MVLDERSRNRRLRFQVREDRLLGGSSESRAARVSDPAPKKTRTVLI